MKPGHGQEAYSKLRAAYETAEQARWAGGKRVLGRSYRHSLPVSSETTRTDIRIPARLRQVSTDEHDADVMAWAVVISIGFASLLTFIASCQ